MSQVIYKKGVNNVKKLTFQEIILTLQQFWNDQGCMLMQAYDNEKGAGTMSPYTFLRAIGPEPWNAAYVEPSRRPADGRYGENPNRLYQHHQFQVVMKPSPSNIQELYLESLENWASILWSTIFVSLRTTGKTPQLVQLVLVGKFGLMGWKSPSLLISNKSVDWQQVPVTAEVTYGLERLASYIQEVDSVYDIEWADGVKYGEIFIQPEYEHSKYSFEISDQEMLLENFDKFEKKLVVLWKRAWFTLLMTMFSNVHTPLICLMLVERFQLQNVPATLPVSVTWPVS